MSDDSFSDYISGSVIGFKPIAKQSSLSSGSWINVLLRSIANSRPSTLMQPRRGAKRRESKLPAAKRRGAASRAQLQAGGHPRGH